MTTTGDKTRLFIDTNGLIRLHVQTAPDHQTVQNMLKMWVMNGHELWISRQVIREYANVLTRSQTYSEPALVATMLAYQIPKLFTLNTVDFQRYTPQIQLINVSFG
jgi:predicted nucleic acid-binding protein